MSIAYPEALLSRALNYLRSAERNLAEGLYDVACLEAEVAAQLALKAVIAKRGLEPPRTHSVRGLLSFIVGNGLFGEAVLGEVAEYAGRRRAELALLERAREAGQYGLRPPDAEEARIVVDTAREVVELARRLWGLG